MALAEWGMKNKRKLLLLPVKNSLFTFIIHKLVHLIYVLYAGWVIIKYEYVGYF